MSWTHKSFQTGDNNDLEGSGEQASADSVSDYRVVYQIVG